MDDNIKGFLVTKALPWVKGLINNWVPSRGALQRIVLRHLRSDGSPSSDVTHLNVPAYTSEKDVPGPDEVEMLVDELITAAMNDSEGLGSGLQRYGLFAYFEKLPMEPMRHPMKIQGGGALARTGDEYGLGTVEDSETPDARGIVAQHMRHTEAMMKQTVFMSGQNQRIALEQNQMLATQVTTLLKQHLLMFQGYEALLDGRKARELAEKKAGVWIDNLKDMADLLKILGPHLVNRIAFNGKEVIPVKTSAEQVEFASLMQTLQPAQLDAIRKVLKPEQTLALVSVMEAVMKKEGGKELEAVQAAVASGEKAVYKVTPGLAPHLASMLPDVGFEAETIDIETIKTDAPEKTIRAIEKKIRDNMGKAA